MVQCVEVVFRILFSVTGFEESAARKLKPAFAYTDGEQARFSGWLSDGGSLNNIGI